MKKGRRDADGSSAGAEPCFFTNDALLTKPTGLVDQTVGGRSTTTNRRSREEHATRLDPETSGGLGHGGQQGGFKNAKRVGEFKHDFGSERGRSGRSRFFFLRSPLASPVDRELARAQTAPASWLPTATKQSWLIVLQSSRFCSDKKGFVSRWKNRRNPPHPRACQPRLLGSHQSGLCRGYRF